MLEKIRTFYRRHSGKFTSFLIAIIVTAWVLGPPLAQRLSPEISIGVSLTVIIVMLGLMIDYLADIRKPSNIQILSNQGEMTPDIMNFITAGKPRTASLLMYSSSVFREVIEALINKEIESQLYLLLQKPKEKEVVIDYQEDRICGGIKILSQVLRNYKKARIRVYKEPASLRGMNLGNKLISMGWYTYDRRDETLGDKQIWGYNNAIVSAPLTTAEGQALAKTFDEVFKNLWNNGSTLKEICGSCSDKVKCLGAKPDDWLNLVSQE